MSSPPNELPEDVPDLEEPVFADLLPAEPDLSLQTIALPVVQDETDNRKANQATLAESASPPSNQATLAIQDPAEVSYMAAESQATDLENHSGMGTLPIGNLTQTEDNQTNFLKSDQNIELNQTSFQVIRRLGKDTGESQVYLLQPAQGEPVVLKYYFPGFRPKMHILQDLMAISHPGIIRILDAGYFKGQFFELLEFAAGGDLLQEIPIKDLETLRLIVGNAAEALKFCHSHQIVHRDIKPDNLFYRTRERKQVVIGDFGISSKITNDALNQLTTQSRTPIYAAPEVYQSIAGKTLIQPEVDYYSLGMTLLYLWTGKSPFKGLNEFQIMQAKTQGKLAPPEDMPEVLQQLIRGLLTVRTEHRWGYKEIERWLAGEKVPVFDAPEPSEAAGPKPFKFGVKADGQVLEAATPAELAQLFRADPDKGALYLQNHAVKHWLEQLGEQEMALLLSQMTAEAADNLAARAAVYILDPKAPLLFAGQPVSDAADLARRIYGKAGDWQTEVWPTCYQMGLDLLESGELQAWLRSQRQQELLTRWTALGFAGASPKGLESMLHLLDPGLPRVKMIVTPPAKSRIRLRHGHPQELTVNYQSEGPGVPSAEMSVYAGTQRKQFQLLMTRQGSFQVKLGNPEDRVSQSYPLRIEVKPDPLTEVTTGQWQLSYHVAYPWGKVSGPLFAAAGVGAVIGLGLRASLSYQYPQPLTHYLGATISPAEALAFKNPYLDYAFCGWIFGFLILLNWLLRNE